MRPSLPFFVFLLGTSKPFQSENMGILQKAFLLLLCFPSLSCSFFFLLEILIDEGGTSSSSLHVYDLVFYSFHFFVLFALHSQKLPWLYCLDHQLDFKYVHSIIFMKVILIIIFNFQVLFLFLSLFHFHRSSVLFQSGNIFLNVSEYTKNFLLTRLKKQSMHMVKINPNDIKD